MGYVALDGYTVARPETGKAISIREVEAMDDDNLIWVPKSVVQDVESLEEGDTDICVQEWFARKEGLTY